MKDGLKASEFCDAADPDTSSVSSGSELDTGPTVTQGTDTDAAASVIFEVRESI